MESRGRRLGCALLALLVLVIAVAANPVDLPSSLLEHWLARRLPPMSSIVLVRNTVEQERWTTVNEWDLRGNYAVEVLLGRERLRRRNVYAFFVFDPFGRLLRVTVRKGATPLSAEEAPSGP